MFKSEKIGWCWHWQWVIDYDCSSGGVYNYVITCNHCVSFTVALVICKLQCILKVFTSLAAQRVFFDDTNSMACRTPWHFRAAGMSGLFSASPVNVQEAHGYMRAIQQCSTDLYRTAMTSSYCVSYRRLAIKWKMPSVGLGHLSTVRSATKRKPGNCRPNTAHTDTVVYIDEVAELICSRDEPAWD